MKKGSIFALVMAVGIIIMGMGLQGFASENYFLDRHLGMYEKAKEQAAGLAWPDNEIAALKAGQTLSIAFSTVVYMFYAVTGFLALGTVIFGIGLVGFLDRNKPTIRDRIESLEKNQKTMASHQDRILTIIEKKLQWDAIRDLEKRHHRVRLSMIQTRDSHGRFRRKGVKK